MIASALSIAGVPLAILCACAPALAADLATDCKQVAAQRYFPANFKEVGQADLIGIGDVFSFSDGHCLCQAGFEDVPRTKRKALELAKTNPELIAGLYCEVN